MILINESYSIEDLKSEIRNFINIKSDYGRFRPYKGQIMNPLWDGFEIDYIIKDYLYGLYIEASFLHHSGMENTLILSLGSNDAKVFPEVKELLKVISRMTRARKSSETSFSVFYKIKIPFENPHNFRPKKTVLDIIMRVDKFIEDYIRSGKCLTRTRVGRKTV